MTLSASLKYGACLALGFTLLSGAAEAQQRTVNNVQTSWAESRAELNAGIKRVGDDVSATSAAINNSLSVQSNRTTFVNNAQASTAASFAELNARISGVSEEVSATSASIGNSASVSIEAGRRLLDSDVINAQSSTGWRSATLNADIRRAEDASATAAAIGNSASVESTRAATLDVTNSQANLGGVAAVANVDIASIGNDASVTAAAIGNTLSVSTLPGVGRVNTATSQFNTGYINATANVDLRRVRDDVSATAAAIGNSVSVTVGDF
ncbi:hypothetical protein RMQ97_04365 [Maricaulis sp. D1M11]|uniref:hypothetical protein n=1 Tax=Maricaulis sp. D1M11 TaxID=3076117 RepID=UPI0039B6403B